MKPRGGRRSLAANGLVTLLSDFGTTDAFVGIMKGVMLGVNPRARLIDLTHEVPAHDTLAGALVLWSAVSYFPRGTVHLAVVDPGVGSTRRALAVATRTALLVGPDNGLLLPAARRLGITDARVIDVERLLKRKMLGAPISRTFHGRDVFAPVAAWLSGGEAVSGLGPVADGLVEFPMPASTTTRGAIDGEVIYVDRFGNLITNIAATALARFPPAQLSVSIAGVRICGLAPAYASVCEGDLLALVGSWDLLEIAARGASAAQRLRVGRGAGVRVGVE